MVVVVRAAARAAAATGVAWGAGEWAAARVAAGKGVAARSHLAGRGAAVAAAGTRRQVQVGAAAASWAAA